MSYLASPPSLNTRIVVLPIQIAALLMTMVRKSIITAGAWHYYYTLSLLSNYIVGPVAGWFNPAGTQLRLNVFVTAFLAFNSSATSHLTF